MKIQQYFEEKKNNLRTLQIKMMFWSKRKTWLLLLLSLLLQVTHSDMFHYYKLKKFLTAVAFARALGRRPTLLPVPIPIPIPIAQNEVIKLPVGGTGKTAILSSGGESKHITGIANLLTGGIGPSYTSGSTSYGYAVPGISTGTNTNIPNVINLSGSESNVINLASALGGGGNTGESRIIILRAPNSANAALGSSNPQVIRLNAGRFNEEGNSAVSFGGLNQFNGGSNSLNLNGLNPFDSNSYNGPYRFNGANFLNLNSLRQLNGGGNTLNFNDLDTALSLTSPQAFQYHNGNRKKIQQARRMRSAAKHFKNGRPRYPDESNIYPELTYKGPNNNSKKFYQNPNMGKPNIHQNMDGPNMNQNQNIDRPNMHQNQNMARPNMHQNQNMDRPNMHQNQNMDRPNMHQNQNMGGPNMHQNQNMDGPNMHQNQNIAGSNVHQTQNMYRLNMHQNQNMDKPNMQKNQNIAGPNMNHMDRPNMYENQNMGKPNMYQNQNIDNHYLEQNHSQQQEQIPVNGKHTPITIGEKFGYLPQ